jgi:hypothetical protein
MVRVSRPRSSTWLAVPSRAGIRAVSQARWRAVWAERGLPSGRCRPGADPGERGPRGVLTDSIPSAGQDLTLSATPDTSPPRASTKSPACATDTRPPRVRDRCPLLHDQRRRGGVGVLVVGRDLVVHVAGHLELERRVRHVEVPG